MLRVGDDDWRVTDGSWGVTDGGWRVTDGGWGQRGTTNLGARKIFSAPVDRDTQSPPPSPSQLW